MKKGLIFDVDGTLVTLAFDAKRTRLQMIRELSGMGFDTTALSADSTTSTIMERARALSASGSADFSFSEVKRRLYSVLDDSEMRTVAASTPIHGALATLEHLKTKSIRLAALTNSGRKAASEVLGRAGLLDLLEFVLTRDDVKEMKPDPEGLRMAVSMLALPREQVLYVGDSLVDITTARRAGVGILSVSTGSYGADMLMAGSPDHLLPSVSELPTLLDAW